MRSLPIASNRSPGGDPSSHSNTDILIKFRHGLGDAVQLTVVLKHLRHYRPDWNVDVAALAGKHSAYRGLCRRSLIISGDRLDESPYERVFNLDWHECAACYADWPSTKAERCLLEVFDLKPIADLCRYEIHPGPEATELAKTYLEETCGVAAGPAGRYPVVLIHYQGNTSAEYKNLPTDVVRRVCDDVMAAGLVPVVLDWDRRSPLPDGKRIFCPGADAELWGGLGTGDAERLAALIELGSLMIGIDSGPLHVAGATSTPTIGVWTRHHPLHYFAPAEHVTHLVPERHAELLRGHRTVGEAYFAKNYRWTAYAKLEETLRETVRERLRHCLVSGTGTYACRDGRKLRGPRLTAVPNGPRVEPENSVPSLAARRGSSTIASNRRAARWAQRLNDLCRRGTGTPHLAERQESVQNMLERAPVSDQPQGQARGAMVLARGFWVRSDNVEQDLVIVCDVAEEDAYRIAELPLPRPVVVDVGAHIGTFSKRVHEVCPSAKIIAVECCPENIPALERNVGQFASVLEAAVTYEEDVALLSSVYPHCTSTGGCAVKSRKELQKCVDEGRIFTKPGPGTDSEFWADFRPLRTVTLEEILADHGLDRIDVLKLDCETSEFSILRNTTLLDRIGTIVGEFHGKEAFLRLVEERFAGWKFEVLKDSDIGLFRLTRPQGVAVPQTSSSVDRREWDGMVFRPRRFAKPSYGAAVAGSFPPIASRHGRRLDVPLLISAKRTRPQESCDLLVLREGKIRSRLVHRQARFARHQDRIWCIDAAGCLSRVNFEAGEIRLEPVSQSPLAADGHSLASVDGRLVIAGTEHDAVVEYDPKADRWTALRPFPQAVVRDSAGKTLVATDRYHLNAVLPDGDGYLLSLFTTSPKPAGVRWRDTKSDGGVIVRWRPQGFAESPLAADLYGPHSLVRFDSRLWWCDSFRRQVCGNDGWRSPELEGFTRGLTFVDGCAVVGLSRSRVDPHPRSDVCGVCVFQLADPETCYVDSLPEEYSEVYDVVALRDEA